MGCDPSERAVGANAELIEWARLLSTRLGVRLPRVVVSRDVRQALAAGLLRPVIVLPAIWWGWRPASGFVEFSQAPLANLGSLLLPALILGLASAAALMRLIRGMLLEVLRQDYVRTAWAKGLRERLVVFKHSLRNAVIPVVTVLGIQIAQVLGGTVVIETIFGLPGVSRFLFDAINQRDYPVIQGINVVVVSLIVLINLAVDAVYAVLDPRIRY